MSVHSCSNSDFSGVAGGASLDGIRFDSNRDNGLIHLFVKIGDDNCYLGAAPLETDYRKRIVRELTGKAQTDICGKKVCLSNTPEASSDFGRYINIGEAALADIILRKKEINDLSYPKSSSVFPSYSPQEKDRLTKALGLAIEKCDMKWIEKELLVGADPDAEYFMCLRRRNCKKEIYFKKEDIEAHCTTHDWKQKKDISRDTVEVTEYKCKDYFHFTPLGHAARYTSDADIAIYDLLLKSGATKKINNNIDESIKRSYQDYIYANESSGSGYGMGTG